MQINIVETTSSLTVFLDSLNLEVRVSPLLYVDLEGNNLSRDGTLSLVSILDDVDKDTVTLVDVTTLGRDAFHTPSSNQRSLKDILESPEIPKVFFDIRNDSDALFSLYNISVRGIQDLQLMELASRRFSKRCIHGLAKCIENDARGSPSERQQWQTIKDRGQELFNPSRGGNFSVFDVRPLPGDIKEYCAQDVALMPNLRDVYREKLCTAWWDKILREGEARVTLSQTSSFKGQGRHMALGPPSWQSWQPSPAQRADRSFLQRP